MPVACMYMHRRRGNFIEIMRNISMKSRKTFANKFMNKIIVGDKMDDGKHIK